jgi:succinate-semialdehyde dehydrogenase / glutarate-semialdehyde dehydrogenase
MVSFTGSTRVGIEIAKVAAQRVLRTCLELGGNAPFIIYDDANLDIAVDDLMACKFRCAGQVCISCNRVFVQDSVYENVIRRLRPRVEALGRQMGNGLRDGVAIGPMTNERALLRIESLIHDAVSKGAMLEVGGYRGIDPLSTDVWVRENDFDATRRKEGREDGGTLNGGEMSEHDRYSNGEGYPVTSWETTSENFFAPTLLSNVHDNMDIASQEIFGPIIALYRFHTEAEVLDRAGRVASDDSTGGLAGYVYTLSHARGRRAVRELHVGMVGLNSTYLSDPKTNFGGVGLSGIGREGGPGLEEYSVKKYVVDRFDVD